MPLMFMAEVINGLSCHYSCRITRAGGQKGLMYLKWHIKRINSSFICKVHWLSSQSSKIPLMKQLAKWLHISASRGAELPCWRGKHVIIIHTLRFLIRCAQLGNQLQSRPLFQSIHVQACGRSIATAYEKPRATAHHLQSTTLFFCVYLTRLIQSDLQDTYYRFSPRSPIRWRLSVTTPCLRYASFTLRFMFEYLNSFVICAFVYVS